MPLVNVDDNEDKMKTDKEKLKAVQLACEAGSLKTLQYLFPLIKKQKLKYFRKFPRNLHAFAIPFAIKKGDLEIIEYLLSTGDYFEFTVNEAVVHGHLKILKYLFKTYYKMFPFFKVQNCIRSASKNGQLQILKYIEEEIIPNQFPLESNYKLPCADVYMDAIQLACRNGHLEILEYILMRRVNHHSHLKKSIYQSGFVPAAENGHLHIVKYLLNLGVEAQSGNNYVVKRAAANGHIQVVKYLHIHAGADIYDNDNCAVKFASANGHYEVVKYLCEAGANPFAGCNYAVRYAAFYGHLEVVEYLHKVRHADIYSDGNFPLIMASANGYYEVVKYLCEAGADYRSSDDHAFRNAVANGHLQIVKYFFEKGVDIHSTALNTAVENGHTEVVKYLFDTGSFGNNLKLVINDNSPIIAATKGYFQMIKYLFDHHQIDIRTNINYFATKLTLKMVNKCNEYITFCEKMKMKIRERAQKKIYFWWIPICYNLTHSSGCGKRMMLKNLEKAKELGMEFK